jgi:hypothetical protein
MTDETEYTNAAGYTMRRTTYRQLVEAIGTDAAEAWVCPERSGFTDTTTDAINAVMGVAIGHLFATHGDRVTMPVTEDLGVLTEALDAHATTKAARRYPVLLNGSGTEGAADEFGVLTGLYGTPADAIDAVTDGALVVLQNGRHTECSWWFIAADSVSDLVRLVTVFPVRGHGGAAEDAWVFAHGISVPTEALQTIARQATSVEAFIKGAVRHDRQPRVKLLRSCGCPAQPRGAGLMFADLAAHHGDNGVPTRSYVMAGRRLSGIVQDLLTDPTIAGEGYAVRQWFSALPWADGTVVYAEEVPAWFHLGAAAGNRRIVHEEF